MKATVKIGIVLGLACVAIGGVLFFSKNNAARFDEIQLKQEGVVLNSDLETVQFTPQNILYRAWNDDQIVAKEDGSDKQTILEHNILFFKNHNILFNNDALIVNTDGLTSKVKKRKVYQLSDDGTYREEHSVIPADSIVKVANRTYYLNAEAELFIGDQSLGKVNRPLLLLDKTGSAVVYETPKKRRLLGHLKLVINKKQVLDVSDEKYHIGKRTIDLASFGGTDNKKLVVQKDVKSKAAKKKQTKAKRTYNTDNKLLAKKDTNSSSSATQNSSSQSSNANASGGNGSNAVNNANNSAGNSTNTGSNTGNQSSGSGTGSGSSNGNNGSNSTSKQSTTGEANSKLTLKDYQELLKKLKQANERAQKRVPELQINYILPEVTSVVFNYSFLDVQNTRVGTTTVEVIDENSDKTVATEDLSETAGNVTLTGLTPQHTYHLHFVYQYDLGNGKGVQSIDFDSASFETENVKAVYEMKNISSNQMELKVTLDQQMSDLQRLRLKVQEEGGQTFYVDANTDHLSTEGTVITITGLKPDTAYQYQAELTLSTGEKLSLNESMTYHTLVGTVMKTFRAFLDKENRVHVTYDWQSTEYNLEKAKLELVDRSSNRVVPYQVVQHDNNETILVPETTEDLLTMSPNLTLETKNVEDGKKKVFEYESKEPVVYQKMARMTFWTLPSSSTYEEDLATEETTTDSSSTELSGFDSTTETTENSETDTIAPSAPVLEEQTDNYQCLFEWPQAPAGEFTVVTERLEKGSALEQLQVDLEEKWQAFTSEKVTRDQEGNITYRLNISALGMETFYYRQVVYNEAGEIIMYVYPS